MMQSNVKELTYATDLNKSMNIKFFGPFSQSVKSPFSLSQEGQTFLHTGGEAKIFVLDQGDNEDVDDKDGDAVCIGLLQGDRIRLEIIFCLGQKTTYNQQQPGTCDISSIRLGHFHTYIFKNPNSTSKIWKIH